MQLQLHRNPGLLDYEAGTPITSPVGFTISLLRTVFVFLFIFGMFEESERKIETPVLT
jgi:hypothetical protein